MPVSQRSSAGSNTSNNRGLGSASACQASCRRPGMSLLSESSLTCGAGAVIILLHRRDSRGRGLSRTCPRWNAGGPAPLRPSWWAPHCPAPPKSPLPASGQRVVTPGWPLAPPPGEGEEGKGPHRAWGPRSSVSSSTCPSSSAPRRLLHAGLPINSLFVAQREAPG